MAARRAWTRSMFVMLIWTVLASGSLGSGQAAAVQQMPPDVEQYPGIATSTDTGKVKAAGLQINADGAEPDTWVSTTLSGSEDSILPTFELDAAGRPHVVYYSPGQPALVYIYQKPDGSWVQETAVTGLDSAVVVPPSLALDGEKVHLVYLVNGGVTGYALRSCTGWACDWLDKGEITTGVEACGALSLIIDEYGRQHTLICEAGILREYYYDINAWHPRDVIPRLGVDVSSASNLTITPQGELRTAFTTFSGDLYWAQYLFPDWHFSPGDSGSYSAPAMDDGDTLAYFDTDEDTLLIAKGTDNWSGNPITLPGETLPDPITALSMQVHDSRVHLAFAPAGGGEVWYVYQDQTGSWTSIHPIGNSLGDPVLRLDASGRACILFDDALGGVVITCQTHQVFFPLITR